MMMLEASSATTITVSGYGKYKEYDMDDFKRDAQIDDVFGPVIDPAAARKLIYSRAHEELKVALKAASVDAFAVFETFRNSANDTFRAARVLDPKRLRSLMRRVVLPSAHDCEALDPHIMLSLPERRAYRPMLESSDAHACHAAFYFTEKVLPDVLTWPIGCSLGGGHLPPAKRRRQLVCVIDRDRRSGGVTSSHSFTGCFALEYAIPYACAMCAAPTDGRLRCGGCRQARYCDAKCQREHWRAGGHKALCRAKSSECDAQCVD